MNECPKCHATTGQVKSGKNASGSQRYQCQACRCRYTPEPSERYGDELRAQAVKWYADGTSFRKIARHLGVDHVTVMNCWLLGMEPIQEHHRARKAQPAATRLLTH